MRFQGLKLIAIAKAIKIILKDTVLLLLLSSFILGSQCTLQMPSWALSTNVASLPKVRTFNATHLPYSFDFFSHLFLYSISSRAYTQFLSSWTLCSKNPDFCPYLLASSHPLCPLQTLYCCPLTSAVLWAPPLPFAGAGGESLFPCPVPSNSGAPSPAASAGGPCCPGQGEPVLLGVSRGQMSTAMGKSLCPLLRTSKFSCIVEAPTCSVSGSYSNCIQVKTPARAPLPPPLSPPLLSLQWFFMAGGEWKGW